MRKRKIVLYATQEHKSLIVAAMLVKRNTIVEVYSYGLQSGVYQTKDLNQAILDYTKWHQLSKVIERCTECYGDIAEQDELPEHDHIYECPHCSHPTHIFKPEEEI